MRRAAWRALGAVVVSFVVLVSTRVTTLSADYLLGRYPGAVRSAGGQIDWAHVRRGWLSRQAVYMSDAPRDTVEAWYTHRYRPDLSTGTRDVSGCTAFRVTRLLVRIVYAVSVTLCTLPAGTRIVINESAFYSPTAIDFAAP